MITNVTIECFNNDLSGESTAEFSRTIDITLSRYVCMKNDSKTLFVKSIIEKKTQPSNIVFLLLSCLKKL